MIWPAIAILGFVTLQRLFELWLSNRNTRRLLARGAEEHGRGHYPLLIALHVAWIATLWWLAPGRPVNVPLLVVYVLLQLGRAWAIGTLGERWTTRIIILPGTPLIRSGPYRFVPHPNYLVVTLEIALLPLVFGLWQMALAFSAANAIILWVRIGAENTALETLRR
jgi:methyltransferase